MLKLTKRLNSKDFTFTIPVGTSANQFGYNESEESFFSSEEQDSINPIVDFETVNFKLTENEIFTFRFYNTNTQTYGITLQDAGFTSQDISGDRRSINTSFFVINYYDSPNPNIQRLLTSNFYMGYNVLGIGTSLNVEPEREFADLHIPKWFLNELSGQGFRNIYGRAYFFNAKLGYYQPFYATVNEELITDSKLYNTYTLNLLNYTYATSQSDYKELINTSYRQKINTQQDIIPNLQAPLKTGRFNPDGTYS